MRAVVSRVTEARVDVDDETVGALDRPGLLVLLGIGHDDGPMQVTTMVRKIAGLRLLRDDTGVTESGAPVLVVSQFTLLGDTSRGRRPSWSAAAPGPLAEPLVDAVVAGLRDLGVEVATGRFGAEMAVHSVNDGPFTVLVEV